MKLGLSIGYSGGESEETSGVSYRKFDSVD